MLTTLANFNKSLSDFNLNMVFNQDVNSNFDQLNNIIIFEDHNTILINNIKTLTESKSNSIRFPKFGYNYEYVIDVETPITIDPLIINSAPSIKNIFFYNDIMNIGYKLKRIKTYLIQSTIRQEQKNPKFHFEFDIDVSTCDLLNPDDIFLIRTLLLQKL